MRSVTAVANPNIAFIKYWGNCAPASRIPTNGSISMNLGGLETRTTVYFDPELRRDILTIDGRIAEKVALERIRGFMDLVREMAGMICYATIDSENNFPMGAGIASSASAFAALALAATTAAGIKLKESDLSSLAGRGSGSACRSIPSGFVEWIVDGCNPDTRAITIASQNHWDLWDCIAVVHYGHKTVSSREGHNLAHTSPLQEARVRGATQRLNICRKAILERDFEVLGTLVELDSHLMHAVMMTSSPRLIYWKPETIAIMEAVTSWRQQGIPTCYTIDAGPNVHVLCESEYKENIENRLRQIPGVVDVIMANPGQGARLFL